MILSILVAESIFLRRILTKFISEVINSSMSFGDASFAVRLARSLDTLMTKFPKDQCSSCACTGRLKQNFVDIIPVKKNLQAVRF